MRQIGWWVLGAALAAGSAVAGGCGAGGDDNGFAPNPNKGGSGGAPSDGGGNSAGGPGGSVDSGPVIDVSVGETEPPCVTCSADLKKVLLCDGTLIKECGADLACSAGDCIADPCLAARESKSTYGCEYWALNLDIIPEGAGACFATFITNTWDTPVHIQVERDGSSFDPGTFAYIPNGQGVGLTYAPFDAAAGLAPGQVLILFLAQAPGVDSKFRCPSTVKTAVPSATSVAGTGLGKAFHITTDRPVVAYQIYPYGGGSTAATSATLLFPTSAWDVNYIAVNAYTKSAIVSHAQPSLDLVAAEDDTVVTINPLQAIAGGNGVSSAPANQPVKYTLSRGQYLQLSQDKELTGSVVLADKPVGMFGGASCLNVPAQTEACDSAQQQIPPVQALGHNYVAVRYRGRKAHPDETVPWRLVGAVDGTQLTYEPGAPTGAPSTLGQGQLVEFNTPGPFVVRSQDGDHPFYLAAYMTGGENFNGEGDPEWVNVVPADQFLDSYVLFTDPTYSETNLVVVRSRDAQGAFADVTLDCAGALTGWQPVGQYEYTRIDLVTGNFQNVGGCSNGRRTMSSSAPFGVTVWGWGSAASKNFYTQYVSYAYPAGESVKPINKVVVPPVPK